MKKKNWQSAFKNTLPVMMGYLAMGAAAGIVLAGSAEALPCLPLWGTFSSALSISGALQFIMAGWIREAVPLTDVILLTVFLNLRYAMYGFSLIDRFEGLPKWKKWYLIWTLTDETYALLKLNCVIWHSKISIFEVIRCMFNCFINMFLIL